MFNQPKQAPKNWKAANNRNTYIPPHVEQAMAKQMQQSSTMQYAAGHMSRHTEQAVTRQLEKNVPEHMKQYVGAFVEQNVMTPGAGVTSTASSPTGRPTTYKPVTHLPRDSHYHQYQDSNATSPTQPQQTQPSSGIPGQPYDFIMNPGSSPKRSLFSNNSLPFKIALIGGGLLVLLILISVIRGFFAPEPVVPYYINVAQKQQSLIHLATAAKEQDDLSTINKNFVATAELSLASSQSDLINYLTENGQTVDPKQLGLQIDPQLDERLKTAAAATTYNQTFKEILKEEITDYMSALQQTYDKSPGQTGRELLSKQYDQAELLLKQLEQTS